MISWITQSQRTDKQFGTTTRIRRDQRAVCCAPRAARRPVSLSPTPVPLRKTARSSRAAMVFAATAVGFRLRLGAGVVLRLRSARRSSPPLLHLPRSPTADRSLNNYHEPIS